MLCNVLAGRSTYLKGVLTKELRGTEGRRGKRCTVKERRVGREQRHDPYR